MTIVEGFEEEVVAVEWVGAVGIEEGESSERLYFHIVRFCLPSTVRCAHLQLLVLSGL